MKRIYSIDPSDEDDKDIIKKCKAKVGDTNGSCDAMQKEGSPKPASGKPLYQNEKKAKESEEKTRFSCIAEARDSTRKRIESVTTRIHDEHIAGKGDNSVLHHNLVQKFFPMKDLKKAIHQILQK